MTRLALLALLPACTILSAPDRSLLDGCEQAESVTGTAECVELCAPEGWAFGTCAEPKQCAVVRRGEVVPMVRDRVATGVPELEEGACR